MATPRGIMLRVPCPGMPGNLEGFGSPKPNARHEWSVALPFEVFHRRCQGSWSLCGSDHSGSTAAAQPHHQRHARDVDVTSIGMAAWYLLAGGGRSSRKDSLLSPHRSRPGGRRAGAGSYDRRREFDSAEQCSDLAPQLVTEGQLLAGMKMVNGLSMDSVAAKRRSPVARPAGREMRRVRREFSVSPIASF